MTNLTLSLIFSVVSAQHHIPPGLLSALCFVESRHNIDAIHHDDGRSESLGVCQIKYNTAKWLGYKGDIVDLMIPEINALYAAKYLEYQLKRYDYDIARAATAYNRGNAKGLTRSSYSDKVLQRWEEGR